VITFAALYWMIGCGLAFERLTDLAASADPDDHAGYVLAAARLVAIWPWWVGRR